MKSSLRLTCALLLTGALAFIGLGSASAQSTPPAGPPPGAGEGHGDRIEKHVAFLTEKLNLTPPQQAQVKGILESEVPAAKAIHENTSLTQDEKKAQWKSLMEQTHAKINAVLTPDQQKIFSTLPEHHHKPGGPGGQGGEQPPQQ